MATLQSLRDQGLLVAPVANGSTVAIAPCQKRLICESGVHSLGILQVPGPGQSWVVLGVTNGRHTYVDVCAAVELDTARELKLASACPGIVKPGLSEEDRLEAARQLMGWYAPDRASKKERFRPHWKCLRCQGYCFGKGSVPWSEAKQGDLPLKVATPITAFLRDQLMMCRCR